MGAFKHEKENFSLQWYKSDKIFFIISCNIKHSLLQLLIVEEIHLLWQLLAKIFVSFDLFLMTLTTSPDIRYDIRRMQTTTWLPVMSKNFFQSHKKVSVSTIWCWCCACSLQTFWKWDSSTGGFLGILRIFVRPSTLLKVRLCHRYFLVNFGKLFSLQLY